VGLIVLVELRSSKIIISCYCCHAVTMMGRRIQTKQPHQHQADKVNDEGLKGKFIKYEGSESNKLRLLKSLRRSDADADDHSEVEHIVARE
jgi:hypothetical protein